MMHFNGVFMDDSNKKETHYSAISASIKRSTERIDKLIMAESKELGADTELLKDLIQTYINNEKGEEDNTKLKELTTAYRYHQQAVIAFQQDCPNDALKAIENMIFWIGAHVSFNAHIHDNELKKTRIARKNALFGAKGGAKKHELNKELRLQFVEAYQEGNFADKDTANEILYKRLRITDVVSGTTRKWLRNVNPKKNT